MQTTAGTSPSAPTGAGEGPAFPPLDLPPLAWKALALLCAAKLGLHLATSVRQYGTFRDELYYLDMARHLDWGYVDAAPLVALYAKGALLMGGSLAALRILPALAGTALVALSALIARELGGGRFAQFAAGLAVLLAPGILAVDSLLSMNAFEPLFWMGAALVAARVFRTGNPRLWPWAGLLLGLGLENKHSTLFFAFALAAGLALSPHRRELGRRWIWIAAGIALALFLPNLVWQARHGFPTLELLENVRREGKNVVLGPVGFFRQQVASMHPVLFPVWLTGAAWLLVERRWRALGVTFVVFFAAMTLAHAKDYYVYPIYPMALAGGAVAIERGTAGRARAWRAAIVGVIGAGGLVTLPLCTWMLPPERYVAYAHALGFRPQKAEVNHSGPLPQPIGDQFGWPEMAREVAAIYHALPPGERAATGIVTGNYGEAGAINLYGPALGLPRAWSRHQNHWYWGPPKERYTTLIVLQWGREDVAENCMAFDEHPRSHPWGMAEENRPIFVCRGTKFDLRAIWPDYHHWN
jgi:hypothetical protein